MAGLKPTLPATVDPRAIDRRSGRPKRVPAKIKACISLLLNGDCKTVKAAGARAGLTSESYLSKTLRLPHVVSYIDERTRGMLSEGKTIAAARLLSLIHAKSERVAFTAAVQTLGINNIMPPERGNGVNVSITNSIAAGYVIDLRRRGEDGSKGEGVAHMTEVGGVVTDNKVIEHE
jgi:hypothetical protein